MYAEPTPTPPTPSRHCDCPWPIKQERAERRGAARTWCARCDREIPLKLGLPAAPA